MVIPAGFACIQNYRLHQQPLELASVYVLIDLTKQPCTIGVRYTFLRFICCFLFFRGSMEVIPLYVGSVFCVVFSRSQALGSLLQCCSSCCLLLAWQIFYVTFLSSKGGWGSDSTGGSSSLVVARHDCTKEGRCFTTHCCWQFSWSACPCLVA